MRSSIVFHCTEGAYRSIRASQMDASSNLLCGLAFEPFIVRLFGAPLISYKCQKISYIRHPRFISSIIHQNCLFLSKIFWLGCNGNSVADIEQLFQMNKKKKRSQSKENKHNQLTITVQLNDKKIKFDVPNPCLVSTLQQCLSSTLSQYAEKISYLQTKDGDWLSDYKIQKGEGWIRSNLVLECHLKSNQYQKLSGLQAYDLFKCIGVGGFSKVYLSRDKRDGIFYAAKFMQKQKINGKIELVNNERIVNQQVAFPFIVQMKEFIQTDLYYVMILDYCPGGQLFNLQRKVIRFGEEEAKKYFIEVLLAIEYLHSKNIVYRDIKPQNIMIDLKGHVQIADFGLARTTKEKRYSFCGSLEYMSPQIIAKKGHSFEVDYYALGVLLYEMVVGCPPFYLHGSSESQTRNRILYEQVQFPHQIPLSEGIKDLMALLLAKDPNNRIGHFAGVKQIKCHPWIGWINRSEYLEKRIKMPYSVNLDTFNFDIADISVSAHRLLYDLQQQQVHRNQKRQRNQRNTIGQSKQSNEKSKQRKKQLNGSKNKQGRLKEGKQATSNNPYKQKCYSTNYRSKQKNAIKNNTFCIKSKKKLNHSTSNPKINKFQSIQNCYLRASNASLSKFLRFPTQNYQGHNELYKQRRSYVRMEGQSKQKLRKQLKKRKAKQFAFEKVTRKI